MNDDTKITLSAKELDLVCNIDWILTKHAIIQKVNDLFGAEATKMQAIVSKELASLAGLINKHSPKIAKGENYQKLPYLILDYPRCFEKERTMAIRTMFWWGNFFSIHLQLEGSYKQAAAPNIIKHYTTLSNNGYCIGIGEDPWEHHFEEGNYLEIRNCSQEKFATIINDHSFIKVGKKMPLREWKGAEVFIENSFLELIRLLKP